MRNELLRNAAEAGELPKLKFVKQDRFSKPEYVLIMVDTQKLDHEWAKPTNTLRIAPGSEENRIGTRYQRFQQWLKDNPGVAVEAPFVSWDTYPTPEQGGVHFVDGRHRFAVLRDMGYPVVGITISKEQLQYFRPLMRAGKTAAEVAKTFYHVTPHTRTARIKREGLVTGKRRQWTNYLGQPLGRTDKVYLFDNFDKAIKFGFRLKWGQKKDVDILRIEAAITDLEPDESLEARMDGGGWWTTGQPVAPECIKEVIPLTDELVRDLIQREDAKYHKDAASTYMSLGDLKRVTKELMPVLTSGLPFPELKIVNSPRTNWLGRCRWKYGEDDNGQAYGAENTIIEIQKIVMVDENSMKRIVAHELAHHEDQLLNQRSKLLELGYDRYEAQGKGRDGHGEGWQTVANRFNAKYGKDFVTKTSDETVITSDEVKPYYIFIHSTSNDITGEQKFEYQQSARLSMRQNQFILGKGVTTYRLTRTNDPQFVNGVGIGESWTWSRPKPEAVEKLKELFAQPDIRTTEWGIEAKPEKKWDADGTEQCSRCGKEVGTLEIFPRGLCFDCYRGKTSSVHTAKAEDDSKVIAVVEEFMQYITPGLPVPNVKVVDNLGSRWLGRCKWQPLLDTNNSLMEIQKSILSDDRTLRRVVAHELCHHDYYLTFWRYLTKGQARAYNLIPNFGHGDEFLKRAAKFNAAFGADFVTPTSDESYVLEENTREFYLLIQAPNPLSTKFRCATSARLSPKQRTFVENQTSTPYAKLFLTTDKSFLNGGEIGKSWTIPPQELTAKLEKLWNEGTPAPLPEAKAPKAPDPNREFYVALRDAHNLKYFAWSASLTPLQKAKLQTYIREPWKVVKTNDKDFMTKKIGVAWDSATCRGRAMEARWQDLWNNAPVVLSGNLGITTGKYASATDKEKQTLEAMLPRAKGFMPWLTEFLGDADEVAGAQQDHDLLLDYLNDYLRDEKGIQVRADGYVEFDSLQDDTEDIIGNIPVVVYHYTSSKVLKKIQKEGLRADVKAVNPYRNSQSGVYVTTEGSGAAVDGYRDVARQGHGGEDIRLYIKTTLQELQPDPDDADLSCGVHQFILPYVAPQNIMTEAQNDKATNPPVKPAPRPKSQLRSGFTWGEDLSVKQLKGGESISVEYQEENGDRVSLGGEVMCPYNTKGIVIKVDGKSLEEGYAQFTPDELVKARTLVAKGNIVHRIVASDSKTASFDSWFGGSKVVDEQGNPLKVYHITRKDFTKFKTDPQKGVNYQLDGIGAWFSASKELINAVDEFYDDHSTRSGGAPQVMYCYLSIKNPFVIEHRSDFEYAIQNLVCDNEGKKQRFWVMQQYDPARLTRRVKKELIKRGYDGIHLLSDYGYGEAWVAFFPNQIKSALTNSGEYDPENHDITASKTASPDFGYTEYNEEQEAELASINWNVEDRGEGYKVTAEYQGLIVGYIVCDIWTYIPEVAAVTQVGIGKRWRGTGLGQLLYDRAIEEASGRGCQRFWSDDDMSSDAHSAWNRLGKRYDVQFDNKRKRYYIDLVETSVLASKTATPSSGPVPKHDPDNEKSEWTPGKTAPWFKIPNFKGVEEQTFYHTGYPVFRRGARYVDDRQRDEFKQWFAGSKIVDKRGQPKLVYHGTSSNNFEHFNIPAYFTDTAKYAKDFGGRVVRAYLNFKNPLYLDTSKGYKTEDGEDIYKIEETLCRDPKWVANLRSKGYDSIVVTDFDGKAYNLHVYIALNPDQVWIADQGEFKWGSKSASADEWERYKREMLAGIVYHGTTKEIAEKIMQEGFRGLEFWTIVDEVLAKYGKTRSDLTQKQMEILKQTDNSYTHEHHLVSTSPNGHTAYVFSGDGGEVPASVEATILGLNRVRDVFQSRNKGDKAVVICRIKNFQNTEYYKRAIQCVEGNETLIRDGFSMTDRDYSPEEAFEDSWRSYCNFPVRPEELEVLDILEGSDVEALANHMPSKVYA